jgi:DNA-binding LacI/PurR family transcriptional regulator
MVTIYEVARAAGVSPKTAARILSGTPGRPRNSERVQAAARKLGYVRNQQAANLRSGRSGLIGLLVPDIRNPLYPVFFQAVHDVAVSFGYQILLSSTFGGFEEEVQALRMFEQNRVEGIILNAAEAAPNNEADTIIGRFQTRNVPVILAGRSAKNLAADEIVIQNREGTERATNYLIKTGHTRIAFVGYSPQVLASRERFDGYKSALEKARGTLENALVSEGAFTTESGLQQTTRLLQLPNPPTAIVAHNDLVAIGALRACQNARLKVPEQVAVVGFDDIPLAQLVTPMLTTLRQPQEVIARDCVNLLIERVRRKDLRNPRRLTYMPELIIRETA